MIDGNRLHDSDSPHPRTVESFEQALLKAPHPDYWGVNRFPGSSSTPSQIEHVGVNAGLKDSKVTIGAVEGGLRVSLLVEEPRPAISIWEYGLPGFKPTGHQSNQIIDASPSRLFEQTIVWDTVRGHEVPVLVTLESVVVKRLEAEQPTFVIGKQFKDTQLAWLSFDLGKSVPANQEISIHSPKEIKDLIEEGERKAKSLGQ
jgi:hypothetical protein